MDQIKIGKFIAELRRKEGLTQQQLGEKLGVTNKTVSRWENGNYMPDIEMLQLLSKEFHVTINELVSGQRLEDEAFKQAADENVVAVLKQSSFTFEEKKWYFIKKWRREHAGILVFLMIALLALVVLSIMYDKPILTAIALIAAVIGYGWQNNRMMTYVEDMLYEKY